MASLTLQFFARLLEDPSFKIWQTRLKIQHCLSLDELCLQKIGVSPTASSIAASSLTKLQKSILKYQSDQKHLVGWNAWVTAKRYEQTNDYLKQLSYLFQLALKRGYFKEIEQCPTHQPKTQNN